MRYIDCTVTIIKDMQNVSIEYVDGKITRQREGRLAADPVDMLTVERLNYWINYGLQVQEKTALQGLKEGKGIVASENPTRLEDLKLVGLILYKILFNDPLIQDGFHTAYQHFYETYHQEESDMQSSDLRMRLKLVFEENLDKLINLPWEFLFIPGEDDELDGHFFSGEKTELLLARYVPRSKLVFELSVMEEQLRILVVVCSPAGMGGVDEEDIKKLLDKMQSIPRVKVTDRYDLTYEELSREINDKGHSPYHILHFIGHGEDKGLYLIKDPTDDDYDAERGPKQRQLYSALQFRKIFSTAWRKPRMIFLHACKGASQTQEGFKSTARQLVYAEIPAVVAMQYSISHSDAGIFARKFYEELGKGKEIDEAVKEGRMQLGLRTPPWEHPRFGTPVVYLQSELVNEIVKPLPELEGEAEQPAQEPGVLPGGAPSLLGATGAEGPARIEGTAARPAEKVADTEF